MALVRRHPKSALAFKCLADAFYHVGSLPEALAAIDKALQITPDDVIAWCNLGAIRRKMEQLPEAEAAFKQALKLAPDDPFVLANLACLWIKMELRVEGQQTTKEAEGILKENPLNDYHGEIREDWVWEMIGINYQHLNLTVEAANAFERADKLKTPAQAEPWDSTTPRPWRRLWARFLDLFILGGIPLVIWLLIWCYFFPNSNIKFSAIIFAAVFESWLLSKHGTTPGKWLLGISVRESDGGKLTYDHAWKRAWSALWRSMPIWFPPFGLLAYRDLKTKGATKWDRKGNYVVSCSQISGERWFASASISLLLIVGAVTAVTLYVQAAAGGVQNASVALPASALSPKTQQVETQDATSNTHLVTDPDGKRHPAPGYNWLNPDDPKDLRVVQKTASDPANTAAAATPTPTPSAEQQRQADLQAAWSKSLALAQAAYPAMADRNSPQYMLAAQLTQRARQDKRHLFYDTVFNDPDAPYIFAVAAKKILEGRKENSASTVTWFNYEFSIYDPKTTNWSNAAGIYIFCGVDPKNVWRALYIGQTDNFAGCLSNHERWDEAQRLGATHIHAMVVPLATNRDTMERQLIQAFQPPLNAQ